MSDRTIRAEARKNKPNAALRALMSAKGIYQWQVAEALGICEESLSRAMRKPLSEEYERRVREAIERLCAS